MERVMLTAEQLREFIYYDPETGIMTWRVRLSIRCSVGNPAGSRCLNGYVYIKIKGKAYYLHRLAWLYMTGEWPIHQIDHVNLTRDDNRWENLRAATASQNAANASLKSSSTTGLKGVTHSGRKARPYQSALSFQGKHKFLGNFDCPAAAHFAYVVAADKFFGEFSRPTVYDGSQTSWVAK